MAYIRSSLSLRSLRTAAAFALAAVCPLVLLATPARSQSGGGRSVFAQGVGNRAVAMGGAVSALSDDASSLLWNPGGLGGVQRIQFEAGQTSYFSLGIGETYILGAVPDWRWGVAAASIRHLGVSGIEQRDDRNFIVGDPTGDSQTEVAIGYGRPLGDAWNVGGSLKARHQSFGGFSASGFGGDIGITGRPAIVLRHPESWASELTWGLALSNLLRPSLRLDRESVTDPTTIRSGVAWHHLMGGVRSVVASADLERSSGLGERLHTGIEVQLLPQCAIRGGMNGTMMTAGTGLRWHDIAFDYAFENRSYDSVHRIGLSYAFGSTVTETRAAAVKDEAERLQARIDEAFQRRQTGQIDSLLAHARERMAAGAYEGALALLASVATLDPARTETRELEASCHRTRGSKLEAEGELAGAIVAFSRAMAVGPADSAAAAGYARCKTESDARELRSTETRQLFAQALDAFGADRLTAASAGFAQVLTITPEDHDATTMLRRTNEEIARRINGWMRQAAQDLEAGLTDNADDRLDEVTKLDPAADGLAALRASVTRARAAAQAARVSAQRETERTRLARGAPGAPTEPRIPPKELELLYRRGLTSMQSGQTTDALRMWEIVWSASPHYRQVTDYLKREYLTRGMEAFAAGRIDEASAQWRKALRVDPDDARAQGYLERAQKQIAHSREILSSND